MFHLPPAQSAGVTDGALTFPLTLWRAVLFQRHRPLRRDARLRDMMPWIHKIVDKSKN